MKSEQLNPPKWSDLYELFNTPRVPTQELSSHEQRALSLSQDYENLSSSGLLRLLESVFGKIPDVSDTLFIKDSPGAGGYCEANERGIAWVMRQSSNSNSRGFGMWADSEQLNQTDAKIIILKALDETWYPESPPSLRAILTRPIIATRFGLDQQLIKEGKIKTFPNSIDFEGIVRSKVVMLPGIYIPQGAFRRSKLVNEMSRGKKELNIEYDNWNILRESPELPGQMVLSPYRFLGTDLVAGEMFRKLNGSFGNFDNYKRFVNSIDSDNLDEAQKYLFLLQVDIFKALEYLVSADQ